MGALFTVAYTLKFAIKKAKGEDYKVAGPEGLWWWDKATGSAWQPPTAQEWSWKLIIRTPDFVTGMDVNKAVVELRKKGKSPLVSEVKLENIIEGPSVQMLHIGPYNKEEATVQKMEQFAKAQGLEFHGAHHEIYLSDPRRVAPGKLRTILRHPVRRAKR
jgi:hypothetical protein